VQEELLVIDQPETVHRLSGLPQRPVLSLNRGFSAPIILASDQSAEERAFLAAHESDGFTRFEAMQALMTDYLVKRILDQYADSAPVMRAIENALSDDAIDDALRAELLRLPSEAYLADQLEAVDPDPIFFQRRKLHRDIAERFQALLRRRYDSTAPGAFSLDPAAKGKRALRSRCLDYLIVVEGGPALALRQYEAADNMTAMQGALDALTHSMAPERQTALDGFFARFAGNALAIDKWFAVQAASARDDTLERVFTLSEHPDFTLANPNRVRSLWSYFAANQRHFHAASGRGYMLLTDMILTLDNSNPQTAARFVAPLGRWRRMEPKRASAMREQLQRLAAKPSLSKDVREQVVKSLG
jgi:aminopeptidase N